MFKFYPRNNVVACAKHFVGDGGTHKGVNEGNTILSYEDLERIHMAPYLDCISQGVSTVMASYTSWNGRKLHADRFLLTEVLKEKLGFKVKLLMVYLWLNRQVFFASICFKNPNYVNPCFHNIRSYFCMLWTKTEIFYLFSVLSFDLVVP